MSQLIEKVQEVFRDVFDHPEIVIQQEMTASDIDGWDSLTHINLVISLERSLGIRFATAEISRMKEPGQNIGSILRLIESKTAS